MSHIRAFLQLMLEVFKAEGIGVFARSHAQKFLKAAQEMCRTEGDRVREIGKRRLLFGGFDQLAGGDDFGCYRVDFIRLGTAALAGAESGAFGCAGVGEELDAVTLGATAGA